MNSYFIVLILLFLLIAVYYDLKWRRIPNFLTFSLIIVGFTLNLITGGISALYYSLLGFVIGAGFFFIFFLIGGMGAGDVKLMGGIGALLGFETVIKALFYIAFVGGIIALIIISFVYFIRRTRISENGFFATIKDINPMKITIPYSIAIGIGTILSFF